MSTNTDTHLRNGRPLVSPLLLQLQNQIILLLRPIANRHLRAFPLPLFQIRTDVVVIPLAALAGTAPRDVLRDLLPIRSVLLHQHQQHVVLVLRPRALHLDATHHPHFSNARLQHLLVALHALRVVAGFHHYVSPSSLTPTLRHFHPVLCAHLLHRRLQLLVLLLRPLPHGARRLHVGSTRGRTTTPLHLAHDQLPVHLGGQHLHVLGVAAPGLRSHTSHTHTPWLSDSMSTLDTDSLDSPVWGSYTTDPTPLPGDDG